MAAAAAAALDACSLKPLDDRAVELHECARYGELEAVEALLAAGVPADCADGLEGGRTPLFLAAANGHLPLVQLLLRHGAAAGRVKGDGNTPLHWAALNGHAEVAACLLAAGAAPHAVNAAGRTPFDEGAQAGCEAVLELLRATAGEAEGGEEDVVEGEPATEEELTEME